jgi:hypothetical protein
VDQQIKREENDMPGPIVRLRRRELYDKIRSQSIRTLAKEWGISDVGLAKICKRNKIPRPGLGYWARREHGYKDKQMPLPPGEDNFLIEIEPYEGERPLSNKDGGEAAEEKAGQKPPMQRIVVPPKLVDPHPIIVRTEKSLRSAKPDATRGVVRPSAEKTFCVIVSPALIDRAMLIMDTLLKAMESERMKIVVPEEKPKKPDSQGAWGTQRPGYPGRLAMQNINSVMVEGEVLEMRLEEKVRQRDHVLTEEDKKQLKKWGYNFAPKYDFYPSGILMLRILDMERTGVRNTWSDTGTHRLEGLLNSFLDGLVTAAHEKRARRIQREKDDLEREERRKKAEERAALQREEENRVKRLEEQASWWIRAQNIRQFVSAYKEMVLRKKGAIEPGSEHEKWIVWANNQADRFDPLVESPPSILDEREEGW